MCIRDRNKNGVKAYEIRKLEQESPNILDLVLGHQIDLIIDIPAQGAERSHDGFIIRRNAIETGVNAVSYTHLTQSQIGFQGIHALVLQFIGPELIEKPDPPAFLAHVEENSPA